MATVIGTVRPPIMLYQSMVEALSQCRVELVRRETELQLKISEQGSGVFCKSHAQTFLAETRVEIARIDALFSVEAKTEKPMLGRNGETVGHVIFDNE